MADRIQIRRDTAANWASVNPVLAQGEMGLETDTERMKLGDGTTVYNSLNYFVTSQTNVGITGGTINGTVIGGSTPAAGSFTTGAFSGEIAANGGIALGDNDKATFGASDDLQIYHTGSASVIGDFGTGDLLIRGEDVKLQSTTGENYFVATNNGATRIYYDNAEKLATTATGIDVTGTVTADGLTVDGDVLLNGDRDLHLVGSNPNAGTSFQYGEITLGDVATGQYTNHAKIIANGNYANQVNLEFHTSNNNSSPLRMKIHEVGDISFYEDTGTTAKFFWDAAAESLGIGVTSPSSYTFGDLAISGGTNAGFSLVSGTAGIGTVAFADGTSGNTAYRGYFQYSHSTDALAIATAGTERFRIASDGSLSTPTLGTSNVRFGVNAGNSIIAGGNYNVVVGDEAGTAITTGSANTALGHSALKTEDASSHNTAIGFASLSLNNGGIYNSALGSYSLTANTTASNNTAVGYASLRANTTGSNNTAIGYTALDANTTGSENVSVGVGALGSNTTAAGNVAVGTNSLAANTTGASNVALGINALTANTTANNNTAVGTSSLVANTTGTSNVALGTNALGANTTASNNTGLGFRALFVNTTGASNVAVGASALSANTTASNNTAVGHQAGASNLIGADNTYVGFGSGYSGTGYYNTAVGKYSLYNSTGSYNVSMGTGALQANTTASNNTAVGYASLGANTTGNSNVALGYNSMATETTGAGNVAVGANALAAQNTAVVSYNTAVGHNAGLSLQYGIHNTLIGGLAGDAITTASNNTAVGYAALGATTTGSENTAFGVGAGESLTTGTNNVLIGYLAGSHNVGMATGLGNVIIGNYADTTLADSSYANVIGYDVSGEAGYTTIGKQTDDIRAVHGTATWATVSDERYKKDIVDSTTGLSFINALRPRTFKYRTLGELPETFSAYKANSTKVFKNANTNHGFIAQEIKAAIDADSSIKDGFRLWDDREDGSQEVAEAALIPVLVKAIQELSTQLDAALARITTLEGK
jgi:trimeric autotransporter adhesin